MLSFWVLAALPGMIFSRYSSKIPFIVVSSFGTDLASSSAHFSLAFTKSLPRKMSLPDLSL